MFSFVLFGLFIFALSFDVLQLGPKANTRCKRIKSDFTVSSTPLQATEIIAFTKYISAYDKKAYYFALFLEWIIQ